MSTYHHIMFDGRVIGKKMSGPARHLINLVDGLNEVAPQNKYTVVINDKVAFDHFGDKVDVYWARSKFSSPMEYIEIPKIISKLKPDIFHNPYFSPIIPKKNIPYIITIHDLINITHQKNIFKKFFYKAAVQHACRLSDRVLTVSEYSKEEIANILHVRREHIDVIYNGIQDKFFHHLDEKRMLEVKNKYELPDKYILYVGSHDVHKNLKGTIDAFMQAKVDVPLVLALTWNEIRGYCSTSLKPDNVICVGPVTDIDLPYIYKKASLFVFMSFIEGFGLPVVEAFASGVPVITSNVTSLPEISRGCAIEVDPHDIPAIASAIKIALSDNIIRERNVKMGLERAKDFTIKRMAERVLRVYDKILGEIYE
ncbi:MAG: glycosyltransferase family 1 protein [Pseudomonadota bacterium]